jgi:hypothetical protein
MVRRFRQNPSTSQVVEQSCFASRHSPSTPAFTMTFWNVSFSMVPCISASSWRPRGVVRDNLPLAASKPEPRARLQYIGFGVQHIKLCGVLRRLPAGPIAGATTVIRPVLFSPDTVQVKVADEKYRFRTATDFPP